MVPVDLSGKCGASLVGVAADGDDGFDGLVEESVEMGRAAGADIEPPLGHDINGERVDVSGRVRAGAFDAEEVSHGVAEEGSADPVGANDGHEDLHEGGFSRPVGPEESEDLPGADLEIDSLEGLDPLLEGLVDVVDVDDISVGTHRAVQASE